MINEREFTPTMAQTVEFLLFNQEIIYKKQNFEDLKVYEQNRQIFDSVKPEFFENSVPHRVMCLQKLIQKMTSTLNILSEDHAREILAGCYWAERFFVEGDSIIEQIPNIAVVEESN